MLYSFYELGHWSVAPLRIAALMQAGMLRSPLNPMAGSEVARTAAAAAELFESVTRRYRKPAWNLAPLELGGVEIPITPRTAWSSPWCDLVHFERAGAPKHQPRVLLVAPMSGHYATLLRGTVEAFLPDHEVYISDWADARNVPLGAGQFDYHDYIDHVREMIRAIGPDAHLVAVCQPGPPVLAAIALMAQEGDPDTPATMAFMGSPIDARLSPTAPNKLAERRSIEWFQKNMIHTVPALHAGAHRRVYPGFLQLASFMGMNLSRHVDAHQDYYQHLVEGDGDNAQKHRDFYDEYLSVMDLSEEFYIQTLREVFQDYSLARGTFEHRGRLVDPSAITRTALMTVEGENDDISGIGQTQAAHDLCANIPARMKQDYIQAGVGHYGVFNGRRFATEIYPRMRDFIRAFQTAASRTAVKLKLVSE